MSDFEALTEGLRELATELGPIPRTEHSPLWLALDQGGHASRAIVFDSSGRQVARAFAPINTRHYAHEGHDDRVEHDPEEIVQSLRTAIDDVAVSLGADIDRVHAAGLATQRSSIMCWHSQSGAALSPVLSWQDRRNAELIEQLRAHHAEIQQLTGLMPSAHYGASKLRWCMDHLVEVRTAFAAEQLHFGPLSTYLLQALLIERPHLVDPANASRTLLWSPASGDWSPRLLELFGVPNCLPRNVPTAHHYGLLPFGSRHIPLTICTGDQAAVPFANGALDEECIYINLGTGAFALAPLKQDLPTAAPLLRSVLCSNDQQLTYALEGTVNGGASALQWLAERSGLDVRRGSEALQRAQVAALSVPLFINGIGGVGSPYWLPRVESRFVSQDETAALHHIADNDIEQLVAVIESIAFLLMANIELMQKQLPQLQHIVVGGGLSSSRYLCECLADLSGLPVTRLAETELTAKGLAFLVAHRGITHSGDWLRDARSSEFEPQLAGALQQRQQQWRLEMAALQQRRD